MSRFDTATAQPRADGPVLFIARTIGEILAPWVVLVLFAFAIGLRATDYRIGPALLWAAVLAVFSALLPMVFIVRGARAGKWDGHHVRDRAGRTVPLLVCFASAAAGLLVLILGGAPRAMILAAIAMVLTLAVVFPITLRWKISMHAAVSAGAVAMLAFVYSPYALFGLLVVALICWSRVVVRHHTPAQVCAGAVLGFVIALGVFLVGQQSLIGGQ